MSQTSTTQTGATETHAFQAETRQVLQLMIHSLYSNKEIFLREMISNASDALDQLRFVAIQNDSIYEGDSELYIEIEVDEEAGTLTVRDNGIGMNREEVMENIGTIAKSGTRDSWTVFQATKRRMRRLSASLVLVFTQLSSLLTR